MFKSLTWLHRGAIPGSPPLEADTLPHSHWGGSVHEALMLTWLNLGILILSYGNMSTYPSLSWASAMSAGDPVITSQSSQISNLNTVVTPVAILPDACHLMGQCYLVSRVTSCASTVWVKEKARFICSFCLTVAAISISECCCCLLVAYRPSNMRVYLRDGSAQTILRAATLR